MGSNCTGAAPLGSQMAGGGPGGDSGAEVCPPRGLSSWPACFTTSLQRARVLELQEPRSASVPSLQ